MESSITYIVITMGNDWHLSTAAVFILGLIAGLVVMAVMVDVVDPCNETPAHNESRIS